MDALKVTKTALALAVMLGLSACSSEETPNSSPEITIELPSGETFEVLEASNLEIPFVVSDVDGTGDIKSISIKESDTPLRGRVSINMENSTITYASPYLTSEKSYSESFDVSVIDSSGAESLVTVVVQTNDLYSPAKLVVKPPSQATGFQKSRTDTLINFMHPESSMVSISFDASDDDADADDFVYDYALKQEGVIYNTDVSVSVTNSGAMISFQAPDIKTAYETVQFEFSVNDGDDTVVATANATIVNKVSLAWSTKSDAKLSESSGGKLVFDSSEGYDYEAVYDVSLTNEDGSELSYEYPFTFDQSTGTISFQGSESGFQDSKKMLVTLSVSNDIVLDSGELFVETSELKRTVVVEEDRDDLFLDIKDSFFSSVDTLDDLKSRNDEVRVSSTISSYAFLSMLVNKQEANEMESAVSNVLSENFKVLTSQADDISNRINAGEQGSEIVEMIKAFETELSEAGKSARELIAEQQAYIEEKNSVELGLGKLSVSGSSFEYDGKQTHFVGNSLYGFFKDDDGTEWEFKPEYKYLASVDITDPFCFD